jgi:hypothetical protein
MRFALHHHTQVPCSYLWGVKLAAKIQIYSPESQVGQEKEDAEKQEGRNLFLQCCKTQYNIT